MQIGWARHYLYLQDTDREEERDRKSLGERGVRKQKGKRERERESNDESLMKTSRKSSSTSALTSSS
jgi:hypothetical protein